MTPKKTPKKPAAKKVTPKRPRGRPSLKTPERCKEICDRLSKGEPLTVICADAHMPHDSIVRDWMANDEEFSRAIARARELGFDALAWEAKQIADTPLIGEETTIKASGIETKRGDMLGHRKLQIETRLKLLAKWDPKRYGEKLAVGGAEDLPPLKQEHNVTLTAEEAYKRMLGG